MQATSSQFINPLALSNLDGVIGVKFNGIAQNDASGSTIASAGDVNGDGIDDILIGAGEASPENRTNVGSTYLIFGDTNTWDRAFDLSSLNGTNGVVINGIAAGDSSSRSVASAGDVNGDGIDDILIGAPNASPSGLAVSGSTYLIFGHRGIWNSPFSLSSLNGSNGVVINGVVRYDQSGYRVAFARDVNGDGIDDILIGAPYASPLSLTQAGSTYLIFGHTGAWSTPFALASLNGANGVVINGIIAFETSGISIAGVGDVNGDGIDDVIISNGTNFFRNFTQFCSAYLIFGHRGIWNSPFLLSTLNGANGIVIDGFDSSDLYGISVASVGDVNGDSINDIMIGVYWRLSVNITYGGGTYLIFGHNGVWNNPLMLLSLNGSNGVVISSTAPNDYMGRSVAGVGDVNGDGLDDVLIGAYGASPGNLFQAGSSYLVFGRNDTWISPLTLSSLDGSNGVVINSVVSGEVSGYSVSAAGDVNGDGLNDMLIGAFRASPGGIYGAGSTYLIFGDRLDLLINTLTINQGETIVLNNSMMAAYHPHNLAINASIPFKLTNVVHGNFSTLNFFQSSISQSLVSCTHDGSIYPLSYEVTVGNWAIVGPIMAIVSFDVPPVLYVHPFFVNQGQTVVLRNDIIRATSLYFPADTLVFNVSNVLHGNFTKTNTTIIETLFNQSVLTGGQIAFIADGSANAPSYDITVSDGRITTLPIHGTITFNGAPILLNNQLTLVPLQQRVVLSSNDLSATDKETSLGELIFAPSALNCHFENIHLPGIALPLFLQQNVENNQIVFVWDGYSLPFYNVSVSDGVLSTSSAASITITLESNSSYITHVDIETNNTNALIGSLVAAGTLGLLFLGFQWYLRKRAHNQLQKILMEGTSDVEKAFNVEVVRPIANKIFEVIHTTGVFGQRTEEKTKAYMIAIGKIVSELRRQNANLDFNTMESKDKDSFLKEIANQTRQQSLPKHKGFSFRSCVRYCKAEVTPQEIEYAAESIARSSITWQKRHTSVVVTTTAINENVPLEKQFKWMQNHVKVLEQRAQERKQAWERLETRFKEQETELASSESTNKSILIS